MKRGIMHDKGVIVTLILGVFGFVAICITGASNVRHILDSAIAIYFLVWGLVALLSNLPREELRKRFTLTSVTVTSCILLAEVPSLLGLVDYRHVFRAPGLDPWEEQGKIFDPELLWVHKPHDHLEGKYTKGNMGEILCLPPTPPQVYDLKYDHHGFRNNTDLEKADIAVVGDSYVESPMMSSHALMTSRLGELQRSTVANLGLSGYSPQQELVALKRYALPLNPKTIVWLFYEGNDLIDVHKYERRVMDLSDPSDDPVAPWVRSFTRNALLSIFRLPRGCVPQQHFVKRYAVLQQPEGTYRRVHFPVDGVPLSQEDKKALSKTGSILGEAYRLCRERGIRFIVVFVPAEYRVYSGLPNVVEVSDLVKGWIVNDLPERLGAIVAGISTDIEYLDLTPIFRAAAAEGTPVFLADDTHWTAEGHRIAAEALHKLEMNIPADIVAQGARQFDQNVALMVRTPDGTIRYWNKGAEHLYGWQPQETLGKSSHQVLKTIFPQPIRNIEAELMKSGRWQGDLVHERRDGSHVIVSSRWELQRDTKDGAPTVIEINREQVAKKRGEQMAQALALLVRSPDGTIHYWNKGAEHLYGWGPEEALGKSSHRVLHTVFPKPLPSIEAELTKTGHWEGKLVHKRRDGSQVIVSSRWELQRNEHSPPTVVEVNSEPLPKRDAQRGKLTF